MIGKKLRLLHIIDSLSVGGAEKLLIGIINNLTQYEHHLIILHGPESLFQEIKAPCKFLNLRCNYFSDLFFKVPIVRKYIKKNEIDIVHSHLYDSNLLARLSTPQSVRLINSIHAISSSASYKVRRLSLYLEKLSYKKHHEIIAVSKTVLKDFDEWIGLKGTGEVLYNYIDAKYFETKPKVQFSVRPLKLVAVGNLRWQKNYSYLVEAFKNINADVQLDIYGEGILRKELQTEIDKNKLPIRLCGIRHDLEKLLPIYDAFVMSSLYEGQPVSLLEAMACGLPAILSDIPVLKEVCEDDALYFDIKNTNSFQKVIREIVDKKYSLKDLAERSYKRVNSFAHVDCYMKKLSLIYSKSITTNNPQYIYDRA